MTEQHPEAAPTPTPAPAVQEPVRGRRRTALVAGGAAVALLAAAGGAVAAMAATADRSAPTAYWTPGNDGPRPDHTPAKVPANALTAKLLPVPEQFTLGPDLEGDGNDYYVSGDKAVEVFKEARTGLSTEQRAERDKSLAQLKLKGLAGRSYAGTGTTRRVDHPTAFEVQLVQADPQALGTFSTVTKKVMELVGDDRKAPQIDGFPAAKCTLMAVGREKEEEIDSLECVAVEGDLLVRFRAYGGKPFDAGKAAELFQRQLNHMKSPGESV
ncbi:hypothetical protein [Streptomyces antimicrobicus]|uniref:Secreted protein n=1 Tax=Streptomyces antimicrobicus TaxID=2883108 RepID=A0ABS8B2V4_9ACTN|nr:hypothetical protein [Streptomyces antimicrobicus]MCB5178908.1 hypothetical protein [Streptomyces antimicrobicus]